MKKNSICNFIVSGLLLFYPFEFVCAGCKHKPAVVGTYGGI